MTMIKARIMNGLSVVRELECNISMPSNMADAVKMWGDVKAFNLLIDAATIAAQSTMRGLMNPERKKGRMTDADIIKTMATWQPMARDVTRDPHAKAQKIVAKLSDNAKAALLKELQSTMPTLVKGNKKAA